MEKSWPSCAELSATRPPMGCDCRVGTSECRTAAAGGSLRDYAMAIVVARDCRCAARRADLIWVDGQCQHPAARERRLHWLRTRTTNTCSLSGEWLAEIVFFALDQAQDGARSAGLFFPPPPSCPALQRSGSYALRLMLHLSDWSPESRSSTISWIDLVRSNCATHWRAKHAEHWRFASWLAVDHALMRRASREGPMRWWELA
jgi:hypothetical protein